MDSEDEKPLAQSSPNGMLMNGGSSPQKDEPMSDGDDMPLSQATRVSELATSRKRKKVAYAESSDSDDDKPLASSPAKQLVTAAVPMPGASKATQPNGKTNGKHKTEESDDDTPISKKVNGKKPPRKRVKKEESYEDNDSSEDMPKAKKAAPRKRKVKPESDGEDTKALTMSSPEKKPKVEDTDVDSPVKPKPKRGRKAKTEDEGTPASPTKGKRAKKKEEEEKEKEEIFRWWEQNSNEDGSVKWQTLEHHGVIFPPPYEPLPAHVKMKYDGQEVDLPPDSEEVAGFFGAMLETDHAEDAVFRKNFFNDWKLVLKDAPPRNGIKIETFEKCDFRPMFEYFEAEKAKKKSLTTAEKKEIKKQKDEMELKYTTCLLDGRKEKVGNFRVEPPGLFRGRGEHPRKGSYKKRVLPEDITLNIGADAPLPVPNVPGNWKGVQHDNTVTWLATWTENVNQNHKYVFLAAGSSLKGQSDMMKFEKARELKQHVDRIRADYTEDLKSKVMADRQRATAMYFIDRLALRAGNEKGEDEADTVGCCSLRCEHLTLQMNDNQEHEIVFDFLGKDSIRYYNTVTVDPQIFKNVKIFKKGKEDDDSLFDRVTTTLLNKHLNAQMKGLTAKVFRTYNASITFQRLLDETPLKGKSLQEKLNAYNAANRKVAILCNHQRAVPKTHDQSMAKMKDRLRGFKYDRMKLRHALFEHDKKYERDKKYRDDESDVDDDFIVSWEEQLKEKELEKVQKKFVKDNEKLADEGKEQHDDDVLKQRIKAVEDEFKRLKKERGTRKAFSKRSPEKLEDAIDKLTEKIRTFKLQMMDRDEGKEVALGTSKINYLDPRITAAWCEASDVPIEKIFSKTLITKFPWAMEVDSSWKF